MEKKYYHSLNMIKVVAILLIFNSHCDILYPEKIRFLATGGAIGNCLFFIISGYLLNTDGPFGSFIIKKIKKIYPATLMSALVYIIVKPDIPIGIIAWIETFIWPTYLWFIGALILFFVIAYFLFNQKLEDWFEIFTIISIVVYMLYYILLVDKSYWSVETKGILSIAGFFKLIYYFFLFCYGGFVRRKKIIIRINYFNSLLIGTISFIISLFIKLLMLKQMFPMTFQFIIQILNVLSSVFILNFAIQYEYNYVKWNKKIINIFDSLATLALYINLAQLVIIDRFQEIVFPINITLAFLSTIFYALILEKLSNKNSYSSPPWRTGL